MRLKIAPRENDNRHASYQPVHFSPFNPYLLTASFRYCKMGLHPYTLAWISLTFLGIFGIHRFYMGKWITGIIYLLSGGLVGLGLLYDLWTLNGQVSEMNRWELMEGR